MIRLIDYIKDHPQGVKAFSIIAFAIMMVWCVTGVDNHHAHTWAEKHIPWFWTLFGLVSAAVLVFVAKLVSNNTEANEDYYDK